MPHPLQPPTAGSALPARRAATGTGRRPHAPARGRRPHARRRKAPGIEQRPGSGAAGAILNTAVDDGMMLLGVFSSLRWGELVNLRRNDVDLVNGLVVVTRTLTERDGGTSTTEHDVRCWRAHCAHPGDSSA